MAWRLVFAATLLAGPAAAWDLPEGLYFTGAGAVALIADGTERADGARFACTGICGCAG